MIPGAEGSASWHKQIMCVYKIFRNKQYPFSLSPSYSEVFKWAKFSPDFQLKKYIRIWLVW